MEWSIGTHGDTSVKFWDAQNAPEKDSWDALEPESLERGQCGGLERLAVVATVPG